VNAYEVKAGIGVTAGKTVLSMPERLACTTKMSTILYKDTDRTFTFLYFFNYILITQLITPQHSFPSTKLHTSLEIFFSILTV